MGKILVTGGTGFIGSHTCVELLNAGYEIIVMDNFSNSKPECLNRIKKITNKDFMFYETDVLDYDNLGTIFEENDIIGVIHFAGLKAVGESVSIPLKYYHNNITGTLNICRVMKKYNCKKIVFSSSATVYGLNNMVPFRENSSLSATNPYGYTKVMIEQILNDIYVSDNGWSISLLRYFNPIGAHESGLIGEDPNGIPNNLLPYISQVAIRKLPFLSVFGNDYDTPDGTGVRDYLHVMDLAAGHVKALEYALNHKGVEAVNLGCGKGSSVLEVITSYEKACKDKINFKFAPRRAGDIAECYADTAKAKALLTWETTKDLDVMCKDSWNFICKNPNGL